MIKTNVNIFLVICLSLLVFTACRNDEDLPMPPPPEVETVQLIISVPNMVAGKRDIGDPGVPVEEGADWDRLAVILAYTDGSQVTLPDGSKVQVVTLSKADFETLPFYNNTQFRLLSIDAQPGTVYIYGVTYSMDEETTEVSNNPDQAIKNCKTRSEIEALTISNDYASTGTNTIDYAKFVSVATGYYKGEATDNQPAAFVIQQGGTGEVGSIPTMTLTRLATKLDIQWDAADAYDQGYTDVKVTSFSYKGKQYGRLFPEVTLPPETAILNSPQSWTFYNTSEISQRNGRVYHYTFTDGILEPATSTESSMPCVTFSITANKPSETTATSKDYTLNFTDALKQAAWYKVNATIKGITGSGTITFGDDGSAASVGS